MTQPLPNPRQTSRAARAGRLGAFLLARSPLGWLVRWVAGIRTSVHTKLLWAFLLIALLIIAVGATSLEILAAMGHHSRSLDEAHERVHWSQQAEHALALQMHYTAMALVRKDEAAVALILRESNRFNDTLARIEGQRRPTSARSSSRSGRRRTTRWRWWPTSRTSSARARSTTPCTR